MLLLSCLSLHLASATVAIWEFGNPGIWEEWREGGEKAVGMGAVTLLLGYMDPTLMKLARLR